MNNTIANQARALLDAPLRVSTPATAVGRALWLYLALLLAANDQGLVIRKRWDLARDLAVPEPTIDAWLARLSTARLVEILSPLPYLTVRLPFWSGRPDAIVENAVLSAEPKEGNSKHSSAVALSLSSNAGEGGPGEGDLRVGVQAMLPEANDAEVDRILNHYPHAMIRKAIDRVGKAGRIRKSKAALFRFLLTKFSEEIDVRDL